MNYVCDYNSKRAVYGPMTSKEATEFILSRGDMVAQCQYCNASRYQLAKMGIYPNNKAGNEKLDEDLRNPQITPLTDEQIKLAQSMNRSCGYEAE